MQRLFNRQHSFITSLFSKGPFTTQKHIVTVCCRRVVTSSRCALHHGKGVTFKLQGGRGFGYGHNIHSSRITRGPANSKSYKTSSWLKNSKSGKSSGSSCTVTKNRKGKIIFRVTRQSMPNVILEECTGKPSGTFRNSINKVFESKLVRTRKSKQGLNDCLSADSKQPVDKLSLPQFKDTSFVNVGHRKTFKNSSFVNVMKKSRSAETHKVIQQDQGVRSANNSTKNENYFSFKLEGGKKNDCYSKKSHVGRYTSVGVKDKNNRPDRACTVSKSNKNDSSTCKKPTTARLKPLVFSSSEMLFSNADGSNNIGVDKMKKLGNSCREHELCKPNAKQVKYGAHSDSLLVENPSIQPLEDNIDSTIKLFMGRNNNSGPARKEPSLSDTVKNFMKLQNDEEALNLECIGQSSVLQASKLDKSIGDYIPRVTETKTDFRKVENYHSDTGKSDGLNESLLSDIASGGKPDSLTKAPLKSSQNLSIAEGRSVANTNTPNVQTSKKGDNITIHRHMDLKRQIKEERVEFDTAVIEQEGKKIMKMKPKPDSNLRRKSSNRSLAVKKSNVYLNDVVRNPEKVKTSNKSLGSTKIESSTLPKTKEKALDKVVIPEDGKKITLAEIDPFIPKMNFQTLNSRRVVIPGDGRTIKEGESKSENYIKGNGQDRDSGKQSLTSEGLVIPQDGNTIHPWETETDHFVSRSESLSNKNNYSRKSSSNTVASQNDVKHHYQPGDVRMYGSQSPVKSEDVLFDNTQTRALEKSMLYGQLRDTSANQTGDASMLGNSFGINQHVFVQNNLNSKGAMQSDHGSSMKEAQKQLKKKSELAKSSPETVSNGVTKPEVAASLTTKIGANTIVPHTSVMKVESERKKPVGSNQVTQIMSESSVPKKNVTSLSKEKKSWRSMLPLYGTKKPHDPEKTLDKKEPLHSSFADSFTTASESTGISSGRDGNSHWSRKVTKIKFSPQNALEPSQTQSSSMSIPLSNKRMQLSAKPKINVTSETATAIVLKSRLAQSPPESVRIDSPQTQSTPNGFSQVYSGIATTNNSYKYPEESVSPNVGLMATNGLNMTVNAMTRDSQLSATPNEGMGNIPPSSSIAFGVQAAGPPSLSNKADSSLINPGISTANTALPSNVSCNMPKASFPPPCNGCHNNPIMLGGNQVCSADGCNTKSVFPPPCDACEKANTAFPSNVSCNMPKASFPPPCNVCHNNPIMLGGNQVCCSADGCNTKSVFPPPCDACETPNVTPDCLSCPTCKPEFHPPCPSNHCSSTTQRAANSCYDPCNAVTKSRTHTIMDIENLPRPPIPICIDCIPKSKPCFPPQCPEQCKNTTNTCCQQMHNMTKKGQISFTGWRACMDYTYWSMKCLLTGMFEGFLTLLKGRIMHACEYKTKKSYQKQIRPSRECKVMQSAVIRPKKTVGLGMSGVNRNHKHVNSVLQQKFRPTTKNKVKKKVRIVKSVKKSVLDDRCKRAILVEEEKRKSIGAKTNPALAYSEVLNIVFSQKKSV